MTRARACERRRASSSRCARATPPWCASPRRASTSPTTVGRASPSCGTSSIARSPRARSTAHRWPDGTAQGAPAECGMPSREASRRAPPGPLPGPKRQTPGGAFRPARPASLVAPCCLAWRPQVPQFRRQACAARGGARGRAGASDGGQRIPPAALSPRQRAGTASPAGPGAWAARPARHQPQTHLAPAGGAAAPARAERAGGTWVWQADLLKADGWLPCSPMRRPAGLPLAAGFAGPEAADALLTCVTRRHAVRRHGRGRRRVRRGHDAPCGGRSRWPPPGRGRDSRMRIENSNHRPRAAAARLGLGQQRPDAQIGPRLLRAQGSYKDYQVRYVSSHSFVHSRFRCAVR